MRWISSSSVRGRPATVGERTAAAAGGRRRGMALPQRGQRAVPGATDAPHWGHAVVRRPEPPATSPKGSPGCDRGATLTILIGLPDESAGSDENAIASSFLLGLDRNPLPRRGHLAMLTEE